MIGLALLVAQLDPVSACLVRQGHHVQRADGGTRPTRAFRRLAPIDRAQAIARCWIMEGRA